MQTFGWHLLQFARSVDSLPFEVVDGMKELTTKYFMSDRGLNACYFCIHRAGAKFEGAPALKTVWSSDPGSEAQVVKRFEDYEKGQGVGSPSLRALAYNEDRRLWVTAECTGETMQAADCPVLNAPGTMLRDHWSEQSTSDQPLPKYVSLHDSPCKTLVALPLKHFNQELGVLVLEFSRAIPITSSGRREADLLARALGRILWLQDAAESQLDGTRKAFAELQSVVLENRASLDPPVLFFAFSARADRDVTDVIKGVLREQFGAQMKLESWDENEESGQITDYIVQSIFNSRFGICYLSEPRQNPDQPEYVDNDNVLIEAGMLQALKNSPLGTTKAWIPVRESDSRTSPMPFDFMVESRVLVPRDDKGALRVDDFVTMLKTRLAPLLQS
jgi:hypothetical protein